MDAQSTKIGIIGGMGAQAGMSLAHLLVDFAQANGAVRDDQFPEFLYYNLPARGMDKTGIVVPALLFKQLQTVIHSFNQLSVGIALMACNSSHIFHGDLKQEFGGCLINMVELAANEASASKRVGVICSQSTRDSGIYRRALDAYGIEALYPSEEAQEWINKAIDSAICGDHPERNWKGLHGVDVTLRSRGAGHVILGCTELPLCLKGHPLGSHAVDAGECAVRHALRLLSPGAPVPS